MDPALYRKLLKLEISGDAPTPRALLGLPEGVISRGAIGEGAQRRVRQLEELPAHLRRRHAKAIRELVEEIRLAAQSLSKSSRWRQEQPGEAEAPVAEAIPLGTEGRGVAMPAGGDAIPVAVPYAALSQFGKAAPPPDDPLPRAEPIEVPPVAPVVAIENSRPNSVRGLRRRPDRLVVGLILGAVGTGGAALLFWSLGAPWLRTRGTSSPSPPGAAATAQRVGTESELPPERLAETPPASESAQPRPLVERPPSASISGPAEPESPQPLKTEGITVPGGAVEGEHPIASAASDELTAPAEPTGSANGGLIPEAAPAAAVEPAGADVVASATADFYFRATRIALRAGDLPAAVELLSWLEPEGLSPADRERLDRFSVLVNVVALYYEQLRRAAETIPGGETLSVGDDGTTVGIVESSVERVVFRASGVNYRVPAEFLPPGIAWELVRRIADDASEEPLMKGALRLLAAADPEKLAAAEAELRRAADPAEGGRAEWAQQTLPLCEDTIFSLVESAATDAIDWKARVEELKAAEEDWNAQADRHPSSRFQLHRALIEATATLHGADLAVRLETPRRRAMEQGDWALSLAASGEQTRAGLGGSVEREVRLFQEASARELTADEAVELARYLVSHVRGSRELPRYQTQALQASLARLISRNKLAQLNGLPAVLGQ